MSKKILLSGIQPSGKPHIGNYFGMIRQLLGQQDEYEVYALIVDYHAMKSVRNSKEMTENIKAVVLDYLALGLNPKKVTFFKQSDVSEHTELCWIFDTMITMPYLMRAHAFKDAQMKNKEIDVGTFNYPVLMAADILLYGPDLIPVGADQKQHVEIARDIAEKFNRTYGEGGQFFKLPEAMIMKDVAIVPGTDGRKMSKSYNNTIPLFAEYEEIKKCVMSIVTDSSEGIPKNVYAIHNLLRPASELLPLYESKAGKYKELKELLIEDLEKFIAPLRKRRKEFEKDLPKALAILKQGGEKAKKIAAKKMEEVREKIGVNVY
ncbi:MAG: Tryptophan-tRNA ligase [Candidatus Daviesbacteria bacterium GW2011_GWB1_39_5]|uniref:Tryptophan--tRNA ligase n=1 Tax=Candidatus Nomurabacteria bacterium RIFCSPLOWO2_02_FULL_40_67 TaxID=1801787 RepID=A0A1F6Y5E2_9BACT|nr:MAG: Tryptophan-tRNA ligase [Candidatus Daviesbacteria bacterium GW2011_GWB1_39_5]KKS71428.1 MAG: Tryptophan-tRNA ligase [Parcubacteria group bacterium GW2011_GWF2_42_7]OGI62935.1 MAG: tryptophan--tRNA ligase [Candidatus Nomurabacteria bacterium RBG_16_40_11]OGI70067.1 MAG: tryptophan--tRNA ligase [Candidatus Nomurabacteria bacterium RIFCSPHIGHO2_01_FULL_39_220]OGI73052.1 MAG: tryptophan--tRNA ligase [Candidatus Nomurabacteria bacterium RIFCSPHIGHO2_02_41_18]OGI81584.1 MAG: tryptophan--tRNA